MNKNIKHHACIFVTLLAFATSSWAWQPSGLVYRTGAYSYSHTDGNWYFDAPGWSHFVVGMEDYIIRENPNEGWSFYSWPYAYSFSEGQWFLTIEPGEEAWSVNLLTGAWSIFGDEVESGIVTLGIIEPENSGSLTVNSPSFDMSGFVTGVDHVQIRVEGDLYTTVAADSDEWSVSGIPLSPGDNDLTISAGSGQNYISRDILVTYNPNVEFSGPLSSSESVIFTGESVSVQFYVGLSTNQTIDTVELVSKEDGANGDFTTVASMRDDGISPDDIPNDGIFSASVQLLENDPIKYLYRAEVSGTTQGLSTIVSVEYFDPLSPPEIDAEQNLVDLVAGGIDDPDGLINTIQSVEGADIIQLNNYGMAFTSGSGILHFALFGGDGDEEVDSNGFAFNSVNYQHYNKVSDTASYANEYGLIAAPSSTLELNAVADSTNSVGNNRVLIWAPYYFENSSRTKWNFEDYIAAAFAADQNREWDVTYLKDAAAGVESIGTWDDYGQVYIHTHGGNFSGQGVLASGTEVTTTVIGTYEKDLRSRKLFVLSHPQYSVGSLGISESLIGSQNSSFPNSLIYIGACHIAETGLAGKLLSGGAGSVVGYVNSVYKTYNTKIANALVDALLAGDTISGAFTSAKATHGNFDRGLLGALFNGAKAYAQLLPTQSDLVILATGLINGDFESGDDRAWTSNGDVRVLQAVGPVTQTEGDYMAILSTGFGSITLEGEEGSTMRQTFFLPDNYNTLTMDYNWVSEEPMEYVGSEFNDQLEITIIDEDGNEHVLVTEDINTSTWVNELGDLFTGGDSTTWETAWNTESFDIQEFQGTTITLLIRVFDVGDSIYDSACFLDNIKLESLN